MPDLDILELQLRVFVAPDRLDATVAFYETLTGGRCGLRFPFPARGLELASVTSPVGSFLVIAGSDDALAPFRATALTALVADIDAVGPELTALGAEMLQPVTPVPTGFQTRYRHADGLVVEYVQHTDAADRYRVT